MKIRVLRLYDDAWGTGQVLSGGDADEIGKQGAFPIVSLRFIVQTSGSRVVADRPEGVCFRGIDACFRGEFDRFALDYSLIYVS